MIQIMEQKDIDAINAKVLELAKEIDKLRSENLKLSLRIGQLENSTTVYRGNTWKPYQPYQDPYKYEPGQIMCGIAQGGKIEASYQEVM